MTGPSDPSGWNIRLLLMFLLQIIQTHHLLMNLEFKKNLEGFPERDSGPHRSRLDSHWRREVYVEWCF